MRVVIADDERLVRVGLASMIGEMESPWQIAGEAESGEALLELLREHKPCAAIVDIRMPGMSGLEAIRRGKQISPLTRWLILSGYSEFAYAQEAMKLGASEYLLKPVQPEELERALDRTYRDNQAYRALLNRQYENSLFLLCNGLLSTRQEEDGSLFRRCLFTGVIVWIDTVKPEKEATVLYRGLYEALQANIDECLQDGVNLGIVSLLNGELAAIGAWDPETGGEARERVYLFFARLQRTADRFQRDHPGVSVSILWTDENRGFEALNGRLQQLQMWSPLRALCGIGRAMAYEELAREAAEDEQLAVGKALVCLKPHIQDRLYLNYQNAVHELAYRLGRAAPSESKRRAICRYIGSTVGVRIPEDADPDRMIQLLSRHGEAFLREFKPRTQAPSDLIEQVIAYVEQHYAEDIGIRQLADRLNVSANYLSSHFHRKTGVMFLKYVTRLRMDKAKELLLHTNLQIKQIAEQVGYYSTRHFTKLFTETFDSYPSDYRKMHMHMNPR